MNLSSVDVLSAKDAEKYWESVFYSSNKRADKSLEACRMYKHEIKAMIDEKYPVLIYGDTCPKCGGHVSISDFKSYSGAVYDKYVCNSFKCDFSYYPYHRGKPVEDLRRYHTQIKNKIERIAGFAIYTKHVEQVIDENNWPRIDIEYYGKSYTSHTKHKGRHNADLMEMELINSASGIFDDDRFIIVSNPVIRYMIAGDTKYQYKVPDIIIQDNSEKTIAIIEAKLNGWNRDDAKTQVSEYVDILKYRYKNATIISTSVCGVREFEVFKAACFLSRALEFGLLGLISRYEQMKMEVRKRFQHE